MASPGRFSRPLRQALTTIRRTHSRRREAEVFPWMEHSVVAFAILGAAAAYVIGRNYHLGSGLILGTVCGSLLGARLALSWLSPAPENPPTPFPQSDELWDDWIDEPPSEETEVSQPTTGVEPVAPADRPFVRPRVSSSMSGASMPLADEIGPLLTARDQVAIRITGPAGSGKSTALNYLAQIIPGHLEVAFLENPDSATLAQASEKGVVVFTSNHLDWKGLGKLNLAPWSRDEWIEYLLAFEPSVRASVMSRLARSGGENARIEGIPELWSIVLDRMAADDSIENPRRALLAELNDRLPDRESRGNQERDCLDSLVKPKEGSLKEYVHILRHGPDVPLFQILRHRPIQLLLAAGRIVDDLVNGETCGTLLRHLPRDLVREAGLQIKERRQALNRLPEILNGENELIQPMAAGLMLAIDRAWKPARPLPRMARAYLDEVAWGGLALTDANLLHAELNRADLWGANLDRAQLQRAELVSADLRTASLIGARFQGANLNQARLTKTRASGANFEAAVLAQANFEGADLSRASLTAANLSGARLKGARLVDADLSLAIIDEADFTEADLSGAALRKVKISAARFVDARFTGADLSQCDLEEMVLPGANFERANLRDALLTGSRMSGANFQEARLHGAGLANIEWERVDLRKADLREATFHLGSSRSGLVGSSIPCEGSRTGFYTDDFTEQDFKSPEEIRKANLRGADLRGANLTGVDFYLVDLRGAKFDPEHVELLKRSGAILETRA